MARARGSACVWRVATSRVAVLVAVAAALALLTSACGSPGLGTTSSSASPLAQTIVTTLTPALAVEGGRIRGLGQGPVAAYLGIPFAAPPVGALRWRPPQPVRSWTGVRACTSYAAGALQVSSKRTKQSESCLFLNVWTPAKRKHERLPVMVWIHGGGFVLGTANLSPVTAWRFTSLHHVVLVSVNYRLGVFGFLAHPALSAESPHHVSGNYGLMDQIAALEWVRRNIAAFGGDPRRVTIFGQSAGGQCVIAHLVSPLSHGLFARAIAESPRYQDEGVGIWATRTLAQQEQEGQAIAQRLGVSPGPNAAKELRAIPAQRLLAATAPAKTGLPFLLVTPPSPSFQPVIDGYVLPDEPWVLIKQGRWAKVPLLIGSNQDEVNMWLGGSQPPAVSVAFACRQRVSWFLRRDWPALAALFPPAQYGDLLSATSRMLTVLEFNAPARYAARCTASENVPTYLYYFARVPPGSVEGAHHGAEIPYALDAWDPARLAGPSGPADIALARTMSAYWATFAATGDPNAPGLPQWGRYDPRIDLVQRLDTAVRPMKAPYPMACAIAERTGRAP